MVSQSGPAERMAAVQAIQAVFGAGRIPAGGVQILPATYGFAQLATWHARMGSLFGIRGVFLTDIDETANRLKIGVVPNTLAVGAVEARLAAMGIPRSAVRIVPMQPFATTATLRDQVRPIEGGLQIAFSVFLCTLGFNGVRAGISGFVVHSHCTDVQGQVTPTQHYQPSTGTGNLIGTEIADPAWDAMKCPVGLVGDLCRYSDSP